jgi:hypothetical protein
MMNTFPVERSETGESRSETHDVLGNEAAGSTYAADMSVDYESLNMKENEQEYLGPEQEEELLAEQERSQSGSLSTTGTRNYAKEKARLQDMVEQEILRVGDPELEPVNESRSDGRVERGLQSSRTGSFASRGTRSTEYERQIRALASKGARPSLSSKSQNSDAQTSASNKSISTASASLPQTRVRSSLGSSSSSRGKRSSQEVPGLELPANYISGTIIVSKNNIRPRQKQNTRQTATSPLSPIKKSGTIITSNSRTTSASFNPPSSSNRNRNRTIDYPTMSREEQILPGAHPSPTSPNHISGTIVTSSNKINYASAKSAHTTSPIQKSGTITFSNSAPSGGNYTHSSAQTQARPTSMTLTEVKRLEDIFGITISMTEPKGRYDELLGGRWQGSRLVRIASIVIIAFLMGLTEAWLVGVWYSNVYGGIYI